MEAIVTAKAALLQALISGAGYGLELIERVKWRSDGALTLSQGSAYPALRALERQGLVTSFEEPLPPGCIRQGRSRIYYELTPAGALEAQHQRRVAGALFKAAAALAP